MVERRSKILKCIQWSILLGMLLILCAIYPLKKIPLIPSESNYGKATIWGTENITEGKVASQDIHVGPTFLQSISIYMQNMLEHSNGNLILSISNGNEELCRKTFSLREIPNYEWYPLDLNVWLPKEGTYNYAITTDVVEEGNILQIFKTGMNNAPEVNREYSYCAGVEQNVSLAVNYRFVDPAKTIEEAVPFYAIVLLFGGILLEIVQLLVEKRAS